MMTIGRIKLAACALLAGLAVSCAGSDSEKDEILTVDLTNVYLSEINGTDDYIELYNAGDVRVPLKDAKIRRMRVKDGEDDVQTLWKGTTEVIEPKSYLCLRFDEIKIGSPYYLKRDFSARKNQYLWLQNANDEMVSEFVRGERSIGWNQIHMQKCEKNDSVAYSFAFIDNKWVYADPTPGSANGKKAGDIDQKLLPVVINEIDFSNNRIELYNNSESTVNIVGAELRWGRLDKDGKEDNYTIWYASVSTPVAPHGFLVVDVASSTANNGLIDLSEFKDKNFHLRLRDSNGDGHKDFTGARYVFDEIKRGKKGSGWGQTTLTQTIFGNLVRIPDGTGDWESSSASSMGSTNGTLHTGKTAADLEINGY